MGRSWAKPIGSGCRAGRSKQAQESSEIVPSDRTIAAEVRSTEAGHGTLAPCGDEKAEVAAIPHTILVDVAFTESTTLRRILDTAEILVLPADIQGIGTEDRGFDPECPTRDRSETAGRCMEILEFAGRDQEVVAIEMDTTTRNVGQAGANRHTTP